MPQKKAREVVGRAQPLRHGQRFDDLFAYNGYNVFEIQLVFPTW